LALFLEGEGWIPSAAGGMKRPGKNRLGSGGQVDEDLARLERQAVVEIIQAGRTGQNAREIGLGALFRADHLINLFESNNLLPRPIVCQAGCDFCCYNQVELTPPEALLLGDYVSRNFSDSEREQLRERLEGSSRLQSGKSKIEIAGIRRELPCLLLSQGRCSVYPVRPLLCRAMHSLDADRCEAELKSPLPLVEYYSHRGDLVFLVAAGLIEGCRAQGCQSGALELAAALKDFFRQERPMERWIQGEEVFRFPSPMISGNLGGGRPDQESGEK
jgi:Fe-S-cluster containining protein